MSIEVNDARQRQQAIYKLEGIKEMTGRLSHIEECDGDDDCEVSNAAMAEALGLYGDAALAREEMISDYHDHDAALEAIQESPLSVEVRSGWYGVYGGSESGKQPCEYQILLCTGGPAVRLVGELGRYSEPETARLEYQDWGTPWMELNNHALGTESMMSYDEMTAVLLSYARQFWFGE